MRLRHLALPAAAGLTLLAIPFAPLAQAAPAECSTEGNTCTARFDTTGSTQSFTVPTGVTNLLVALGGASGGDGLEEEGGQPQGGQGGALEAIVPVTPGQVLTLVVGGKGGDAVATPIDKAAAAAVPPVAQGGYGGGGDGTSALDGPVGAGGGGSFLYSGNTLLLAAGGGGGAGYTGNAEATADGGSGGASAAGTAAVGQFGGQGATTSAGGAAGGGDDGTAGSGPATGPAAFGNGGAAAGTCSAGGGGGGYFGGGSGGCDEVLPDVKQAGAKQLVKAKGDATAAADPDFLIQSAGGGGGGAGFVGAGVSQVAEFGDGVSGLDDGVIVLVYTTAATTTTLTSNVTTLAPGQEATLDATVAGPDLTIGSPSDESSPAGKAAAAAFGSAKAKTAKAVPGQPAAPGTTVNPATACGTAPCTVTFFVNGTQLGDPITVDPASKVATVIFTAGSDLGVREVTARYDGNLYYLQSTSDPLSLTVAGLANTGPSNVAPMITASAALLVAGAGLLAFGRRRPQTGSHRAA